MKREEKRGGEGSKESFVVSSCLRYLKANGVMCWRNNTGALEKDGRLVRFGTKGSADIIGVLDGGRFLAVECKREGGGVLSEAQEAFLRRARERGALALAVCSLAELKEKTRGLL